MLLELIPPSPTLSPFRLFIDFADLSHGHPNPFAWTSQLSTLLQHELDLPRSMHMFDKAVGRTTLLETVRFDLRNAKSGAGDTSERGTGLASVRCEFVDGGVLEWSIPIDFGFLNNTSTGCTSSSSTTFLRRLQWILKDVQAMRLEEERAKLAAQYERQQKHRPNSSSSSNAQAPVSVGPSLARRLTVSVMRHSNSMPSMNSEVPAPKTHKRQKSFLRSLASAVGSIKKMNSSSATGKPLPLNRSNSSPISPAFQRQSQSNEPGQTEEEEPFLSTAATHDARAQVHRNRVRAALLDTYRRFVLAGLASGGSSPSPFLPPIEGPSAHPDDHDVETSDSSSTEEEDAPSSDDEEDKTLSTGGRRDGSTSEKGSKCRPPTPAIPSSTARIQRKRNRAGSNATSSTNSFNRDPYAPGKRETYSYYMWVLRSMLRRTEEEMEQILKDCEETRKREIEADELADMEGDRAENARLLRVRQREEEFDRFELEANAALSQGLPKPTMKKSPSKLLRKRSDSHLVGPEAPSGGPTPKFSFGQFMKRKSKQMPPVDSSKPPSRIPRLTSRPSFPPPNMSATTLLSPPFSPNRSRLVQFAAAPTSNETATGPTPVQDVHDDSGRFSPTTMEVPSLFSDSDSDEGGTIVETEEDPAFLTSRSNRAGTVSTCSSLTSTRSESADSEMTVSTAPTSPSSSPPLPSIRCDDSDALCEKIPSDEGDEATILPTAPLKGEEVVLEGGQEIECGYAVTCDEAVGGVSPRPHAREEPKGTDLSVGSIEVISTSVPQMPQSSASEPDTPSNPKLPTRPMKPFILPASYNRLLDLTHKLRSLLIHATLSVQAIKEEEERTLELLETRGKRRAWSGGAFMRGVTAIPYRTDEEIARARAVVLSGAKERAAEKRMEWKAKAKEERRLERRQSRKRHGDDDSDDDSPSHGVAFVNTKKLPPLPFLALSVPATSSPLAVASYTAEDKEEREGVVYVCPVKEETVFYTWLKGRSGFEVNAPSPNSKRGRLSMDSLSRSVLSTRELKVRKSDAAGLEDGYMEFGGGMVDENGFLYAHDFGRYHDAERSAHGFPLLDPLDREDDDGIEWQTPSRDFPDSPPLSPTSMDTMIPPRPRLLPTVNHIPSSKLLPLVDEEAESDEEGTTHSPSSGQSRLTSSGASTPVQSDDEDEFEFDRLRLTRLRFIDEEPASLDEDDEDDDGDEEFYADISHITHFVDGIDRKTKGRPPRRVSCDESSMYHRQRKRSNVVSGGSLTDGADQDPLSPITSDSDVVSMAESHKKGHQTQPSKRSRNHRRQWQMLADDPKGDPIECNEEAKPSSPLSPVEEHPEENLRAQGLRKSLEAERSTPIGSGKAKFRPRNRTRSMYQRLSPISPRSVPLPPIMARRSVSEPLPKVTPLHEDVADKTQCYIPYGRVDIGTSANKPLCSESLSQGSLLCQPIRFNHLPGSLRDHDKDLKPTVKLVTKTLAASPPPPHPSPPIFVPSPPKLSINLQVKSWERSDMPDVPRSPSPLASRTPSPPPARPLSPTLSLGGSIFSTQSSLRPITPVDDLHESLHEAHLHDVPAFASSFDCGMEFDSGVGEEFTLAMDVHDRKRHTHHQQAKKQVATKKSDGAEPIAAMEPAASLPASPVRGTTTTKSAMRRRGVDLGFLEAPAQ